MTSSQQKPEIVESDRLTSLGVKERLVLCLGIFPQNIISYAVGVAARLECPKIIQMIVNRMFVKIFGIDMTEAKAPLSSFKSLEDVFIRELKDGQRKIKGPYVASADGVLEVSLPAKNASEAVQAKGIRYSISELVLGHKRDELDVRWYSTIYLAPHNYHRVHSPVEGQITNIRYIPGRLWPVNRPAVRAIRGLFIRNERLVFDIALKGGGRVWVVLVGAFNVGRIASRFVPEFTTNSALRIVSSKSGPVELSIPHPIPIAAGDEIGIFLLGSTTVVALDGPAVEAFKPREVRAPLAIKMGDSLSLG